MEEEERESFGVTALDDMQRRATHGDLSVSEGLFVIYHGSSLPQTCNSRLTVSRSPAGPLGCRHAPDAGSPLRRVGDGQSDCLRAQGPQEEEWDFWADLSPFYGWESAVTNTSPPKAGIINLLVGVTLAEIREVPGLIASTIDCLPPSSKSSLLSSRRTDRSLMRRAEA